MAKGLKIGEAYVEIGADLAKVEAGLNQLPAKVSRKILELKQKTQAQIARNRLEMKVAINTGDMKGYDQLVRWNQQLAAVMERVNVAARNQAQALQKPMAVARQAPSGPKASSSGGSFGGGAMGLMMLSQTIDDAQYGFRAVVNNIPMVTMALGQAVGWTDKFAMKLGALGGIAAVAINVIINHWDQLFARFGYGTDTMKMVWTQMFGETKDVAITALDAIEARIKELEAKPIKLAVDMFELDQAREKAKELKEATEAWERMGKSGNPLEQAAGSDVGKLFSGMGQAELDALRDKMVIERANAAGKTSPAIQNENLTDAEKEDIRRNIRAGASMNRGQAGGFAVDTSGLENQAIEAEQKRRQEAAAKVREANKAQAKQELGGMLANAGGDAGARGNLARALRGAGREDLAKKVEGISPEAVKARQEAAEQEAIETRGRQNTREFLRREREKKEQQLEQESGRVAGAMAGGAVQRKLLANNAYTDEGTVQRTVQAALEKSGMGEKEIAEILPRVAKKVRERIEKGVQERALDKGIGKNQAAAEMLKEENEKAAKEEDKNLPKSQVMSTDQYLNTLLTASLSKSDVPNQQLNEQKTTNRKLDELPNKLAKAVGKNKSDVARFTAARGPA